MLSSSKLVHAIAPFQCFSEITPYQNFPKCWGKLALAQFVFYLAFYIKKFKKRLTASLILLFSVLCIATQVVRIGHPARLMDTVQNVSLEALLARTDAASIIEDVKSELQKALASYCVMSLEIVLLECY